MAGTESPKAAASAVGLMANPAGIKSLVCFAILALACIAGFSSREACICDDACLDLIVYKRLKVLESEGMLEDIF